MSEIKLWRCKICGDPYIGEGAPDECPFCGAHKNFMIEANKFDNAGYLKPIEVTTLVNSSPSWSLMRTSSGTFSVRKNALSRFSPLSNLNEILARKSYSVQFKLFILITCTSVLHETKDQCTKYCVEQWKYKNC